MIELTGPAMMRPAISLAGLVPNYNPVELAGRPSTN